MTDIEYLKRTLAHYERLAPDPDELLVAIRAGAARRARRRRALASASAAAAAGAVVLAAGVASSGVGGVGGHSGPGSPGGRPRPDAVGPAASGSPTASAPPAASASPRPARTCGVDLGRPDTRIVAVMCDGGQTSWAVLYQVGALDAARYRREGEPVTVRGQVGYVLATGRGTVEVAWQYAPDAWIVVESPSRAETLRTAEALELRIK